MELLQTNISLSHEHLGQWTRWCSIGGSCLVHQFSGGGPPCSCSWCVWIKIPQIFHEVFCEGACLSIGEFSNPSRARSMHTRYCKTVFRLVSKRPFQHELLLHSEQKLLFPFSSLWSFITRAVDKAVVLVCSFLVATVYARFSSVYLPCETFLSWSPCSVAVS